MLDNSLREAIQIVGLLSMIVMNENYGFMFLEILLYLPISKTHILKSILSRCYYFVLKCLHMGVHILVIYIPDTHSVILAVLSL